MTAGEDYDDKPRECPECGGVMRLTKGICNHQRASRLCAERRYRACNTMCKFLTIVEDYSFGTLFEKFKCELGKDRIALRCEYCGHEEKVKP